MNDINNELFKIYILCFDTVSEFDNACLLDPECVDIGYSDLIIAFETDEQRVKFKARLK